MSEILAPVITVDGPSSSGKGTISKKLAEKLQWHFLDSGALYRVLAYATQLQQLDFNNHAEIASLAQQLDVKFVADIHDVHPRVILAGEDVTDAIRSEECGRGASLVGAIENVRKALLNRQRIFRKLPGLIADGRDMGTVIFPDAKFKFYLIAGLEVRAQRRLDQLKDKNPSVNFEKILDDLSERDRRDRDRSFAPMVPAEDAVIIDTSNLSVAEVLQAIWQVINK